MANPTTNYGFVLPTSSDLVTDLPADFDVALQGVDTRLKALQPGTTLGDIAYSSATANTSTRLPIGTTGQVLTVAGGVPTWATGSPGDIEGVTAGVGISGGGSSGTVTVTNSMATAIDAKGDLIAGTAADTFSRLAIGSNNQVLTADSAEATGMKWASPTASTATLTQIATGTLSGTQLSLTGLSSYDQLYLVIYGTTWSTGQSYDRIRVNGSTNVYAGNVWGTWATSSFSTSVPYGASNAGYNSIAPNATVGGLVPGGNYGESSSWTLSLTNCKAAGRTSYDCYQAALDTAGSKYWVGGQKGIVNTAAAISSLTYETNNGYTFTGGTYVLWGA
jgi:hypothetical protein